MAVRRFSTTNFLLRWLAALVLVLLATILAVGLSWSHIRRRLSGQVDMDMEDV